MKKFLAGAIVAIIIICSAFAVISLNTVAPAKKIIDKVEQTTTPDPVVIKPSPAILIEEIQKLEKLETASMNISQVFPVTKDNERFWGVFGEELVFVANGQAIAGVDFSSVNKTDFKITNDYSIEISLPQATIFNIIIDNNTSAVVSHNKGFLAKSDPQLETQVRKTAQNEFQKIAENSELLKNADINAQDNIRNLAKNLGFTTVTFSTKK